MKYMIYPKAIGARNVINEEKVDAKASNFYQYTRVTIVNDPKFGKDVRTLFRGEKICDLLRPAKEGDEIGFEDDDHELLLDVAENPTGGFKQPLIGIEVLPYIRAIKDVTSKPRKKKGKGKDAKSTPKAKRKPKKKAA